MCITRILFILFAACNFNICFGQNTDEQKARLFSRDSVELFKELQTMSVSDQQYRKSTETFHNHISKVNGIDSMNTTRMIEIINTYGFPSVHRFKLKKNSHFTPHIILVHANQQFADTLSKLLLVEKNAGRISPNEYAHIDWHLKGRKGIPQFERGKVKKRKNGSTSIKFTGF